MSAVSAVDKLRFIGNYDFASQGKFLWEILCQLRNMGTGRYVTKTEWLEKWPSEPSYLKIVKARPTMDRWMQGGKLWAEWTFRGRALGIYEFSHDLNRSDWRLIHKHEEKGFLENKNAMKEVVFPDSFPLPPLQILLAKKDAAKNGKTWTAEQERAPLQVCLDSQFEMLRPLIKQAPPQRLATNIYDEVDPDALLDFFGDKLPVKVEAWNVGAARISLPFQND